MEASASLCLLPPCEPSPKSSSGGRGWGGTPRPDPRSRLPAARSVVSGGRVPAGTPPPLPGAMGQAGSTDLAGDTEVGAGGMVASHRVQDFGSSPALSHPGIQCESSDPHGRKIPIFSRGTKSFLIPAQNRSCGDRGRAGRGLLAGGRTPSLGSRAAHQAGDSGTSNPTAQGANPADLGTAQGPGAKGTSLHHGWAHRAQQCLWDHT